MVDMIFTLSKAKKNYKNESSSIFVLKYKNTEPRNVCTFNGYKRHIMGFEPNLFQFENGNPLLYILRKFKAWNPNSESLPPIPLDHMKSKGLRVILYSSND